MKLAPSPGGFWITWRGGVPVCADPFPDRGCPSWRGSSQAFNEQATTFKLTPPSMKLDQALEREPISSRVEVFHRPAKLPNQNGSGFISSVRRQRVFESTESVLDFKPPAGANSRDENQKERTVHCVA
jgi:hypothetical protein